MPAAKKPSAKKTTEKKAAPKKAAKPALPDVNDDTMTTQEFVKACYLAILGREADAAGLKHYTQTVDLHRRPRQDVIDALSSSPEAKA